MIVSLHVATGAAAGAALRSRTAAIALGPVLHFLGDRVPHHDFSSEAFEAAVGISELTLLGLARGFFDPATLCAAAAAAPDLEHVLPLPRPGGRQLFPSHRIEGWHRDGGLSTSVQMVIAGALLGAVVAGGLVRRTRG
jgi:hypothetical protein